MPKQNPTVKWASYGNWSGPSIRGQCAYKPPSICNEWDVISYTVAVPEGGNYDGVFAADGTAVTFGLYQWTLTSTRLQGLLFRCLDQVSDVYLQTVGALFDKMGLQLSYNLSQNVCELSKNGKVLNMAALRNTFTPPGGKCPKSGPNWQIASGAALAFWQLGQDPDIWQVQQDFFKDEIQIESVLKRPKLNGKSIASILYPAGSDFVHDGMSTPTSMTPMRALFFSLWQNGPREAERVLGTIPGSFKDDPKAFTKAYAKKIANSNYGNWGIYKAALCPSCGTQNKVMATKCTKCKKSLRISRYTKIAKCVNALMGAGTLALVP